MLPLLLAGAVRAECPDVSFTTTAEARVVTDSLLDILGEVRDTLGRGEQSIMRRGGHRDLAG